MLLILKKHKKEENIVPSNCRGLYETGNNESFKNLILVEDYTHFMEVMMTMMILTKKTVKMR